MWAHDIYTLGLLKAKIKYETVILNLLVLDYKMHFQNNFTTVTDPTKLLVVLLLVVFLLTF